MVRTEGQTTRTALLRQIQPKFHFREALLHDGAGISDLEVALAGYVCAIRTLDAVHANLVLCEAVELTIYE
jgi:hypothetical protein